jgi:hypothetical protein
MQELNQIAKAIASIERIISEMDEQIKKNEAVLGVIHEEI